MPIIRCEYANCLLSYCAKSNRFDRSRGDRNEKLVAHNTILWRIDKTRGGENTSNTERYRTPPSQQQQLQRSNDHRRLGFHMRGLVALLPRDHGRSIADDLSYRLTNVLWEGIGNKATGFAAIEGVLFITFNNTTYFNSIDFFYLIFAISYITVLRFFN